LSARLRPTVRREDLLARYGGEEFCLVLVETGPEKAARAGERVRQEVADRPFVFGSKSIALTVSVGVATTCGEAELAPLELVTLADQNLYEAKRTGRDRVVASP
jgi:diguanylate cyclase (GGDEF)-like protein